MPYRITVLDARLGSQVIHTEDVEDEHTARWYAGQYAVLGLRPDMIVLTLGWAYTPNPMDLMVNVREIDEAERRH